jgi:hypothetical protein
MHSDGHFVVVDGEVHRAAEGLLDAYRCATAAGEVIYHLLVTVQIEVGH